MVCANRGVLEQLPTVAGIKDKKWYKQVSQLTTNSEDLHTTIEFPRGNKTAYESAKLNGVHLDHKRISLGNPAPVDILINKLCSDSRWSNCTSCELKPFCPFNLNREALMDGDIKKRFLKILSLTELYRGQALVFREAGSLLSIVLAGPSSDYAENESPCNWVRSRYESSDFHSLMSRRFYMVLFAGSTVCGLESDKKLRESQLSQINKVVDLIAVKASICDASPISSSIAAPILGCTAIREKLSELVPI